MITRISARSPRQRPWVRRNAVWGLCLALTLAACGGAGGPASEGAAQHEMPVDDDGFRGAGLSAPYEVPDVTLTDTSGAPYNLVEDTEASATVVFFGYTYCPDVCSLVMADLASAFSRLDPEVVDNVEMLFITTDPARDDPETIRRYLDRFDPSFEGLTGSLEEIKRAALPLGIAIEGKRRLPTGGYEVGHSSAVVGIDAHDKAQVVWTEGTPVGDLVSDITTLAGQA